MGVVKWSGWSGGVFGVFPKKHIIKIWWLPDIPKMLAVLIETWFSKLLWLVLCWGFCWHVSTALTGIRNDPYWSSSDRNPATLCQQSLLCCSWRSQPKPLKPSLATGRGSTPIYSMFLLHKSQLLFSWMIWYEKPLGPKDFSLCSGFSLIFRSTVGCFCSVRIWHVVNTTKLGSRRLVAFLWTKRRKKTFQCGRCGRMPFFFAFFADLFSPHVYPFQISSKPGRLRIDIPGRSGSGIIPNG